MRSKTDPTRYSIGDLERLAGMNRRTIHFYVAQEVLPPPEGAGVAAKYTEEHLQRLILVKQLKKGHLKLAGIKAELSGLSVQRLRELSQQIEKQGPQKWNYEALADWIEERPDRNLAEVREDISIYGQPKYSLGRRGGESADHDQGRSSEEPTASFITYKSELENTSWERHRVIDGVEMHIRQDIADEHKTDIETIMKKLRQIMEAE